MTSYIQSGASHSEGVRAKSAADPTPLAGRSFDDARGLATLLLAAVVAAMVVVADQMISSWVDGELLLGWVVLWAVGFVALVFLTGTAKRTAARLTLVLDEWARAIAKQRAEERMWQLAQRDPRVMAEIRHAQGQANADFEAANANAGTKQPARGSLWRDRGFEARYF